MERVVPFVVSEEVGRVLMSNLMYRVVDKTGEDEEINSSI